MQKVITIKNLRGVIKQWRLLGHKIAFVPTMGNLHAGHIKLVKEAKKAADKVVVSIFVNPTQFGEGEDFNTYPRTEMEDLDKLKEVGVDLLFFPTTNEVYASGSNTVVSNNELSKLYCGASRPGHFDGVTTVVTKLFNMVQPDLSFFGQKDFQQLLLIQTLVQDLNIPVKIMGVATEREFDGLAMSSRNGYLSDKERLIAPKLYQSLCRARDLIVAGHIGFRTIEQQGIKHLEILGFVVDYFSICRSNDMQLAIENDRDLVVITAAKLGLPRLIDNICLIR